MHSDVQSLLAVQLDDLEIYALEDKLQSLAPRLKALEKERQQVATELASTNKAIAAEESRQREAKGRTETHRQLAERSQRQYESVTSPREATAALGQLEQTKRMVEESARDAEQIQKNIDELRHRAASLEKQLADLDARQADARASLANDRIAIEAEMAVASAKREAASRKVPRAMLNSYERVRVRKHGETVFPLRGASCSACDTAIPTQRRASMAATGALEMCEGCGVLLYAAE